MASGCVVKRTRLPHDRVFGGRKFWRVACGFSYKSAQQRATTEREGGHRARVVKAYDGEYRVYVDYNPYK